MSGSVNRLQKTNDLLASVESEKGASEAMLSSGLVLKEKPLIGDNESWNQIEAIESRLGRELSTKSSVTGGLFAEFEYEVL